MTFERLIRRAGRTVLMYGWFLALSVCMTGLFDKSFYPYFRAMLTGGTELIIMIGSTVLSLFALYSCIRQFATDDGERYLALAAKGDLTAPEWRRVISSAWKSPSFLCEAVVLTAIILAVPPVAGWSALVTLADTYLALPATLHRLLVRGVVAVAANVFHCCAYFVAVRAWRTDARTKDMMPGAVGRRRMMSPGWRRLLLYGLFVTLGYLFLSSTLLPVCFVIGAIFVTLANALTWQLAVVVLCLLLLLTGHRYLRAFRALRRFKKDLKAVCREAGYTCTDVKHLYRSVFTGRRCGTFTVLVGDKRYVCCIVSSVRRRNQMYLLSDGCAHEFAFRLFRRVLFRYYRITPFTFPDNGEKIVIVHPTPCAMLAPGSDGVMREGITGDRIGSYTLYNGKNFLGCLSRDCLCCHH